MSQREGAYPGSSSWTPSEVSYNYDSTDDDDDDNDEDAIVVFAAVASSINHQRQASSIPYNQQYFRNCIDWDSMHVEQLHLEDEAFRSMYRMRHISFVKLCTLIDPFLTVNPAKSKLWTAGKAPITTEVALHCLLQFLSGCWTDKLQTCRKVTSE
jgi:hypothetical protein